MSLDRRTLIGFVSVMGILFFVLNRNANGFLPDARLYPFVMTAMGAVLAVFALFRVLTGKEPVLDSASGKAEEESHEEQLEAYRQAGLYALLIVGFYLGIWLVGFRIAAAVFTFSFMKYSGLSAAKSAIFAAFGLVLVEVLSRLLQLVLPGGLWYLLGV